MNSYFGRQMDAKDPLYWRVRDRNFGVYNESEQIRLRDGHACVVGLGCVGELQAVMLARIGVGHITLVDFDRLELSNLNRNPYAIRSGLGHPKVTNMVALIREVDNTLDIVGIDDRLRMDNGVEIFQGKDVILQAVDEMASRVVIHRCARKAGVPCVTMSGAPPFRAFVTSVLPNGMDYETFLDLPTRHFDDDELTSDGVAKGIRNLRCERTKTAVRYGAVPEWADLYLSGARPVWAVTPQRPYMTAVLAAHEAVKTILGRPNRVIAPEYLRIDLDREDSLVLRTNKSDTPIDYTTF